MFAPLLLALSIALAPGAEHYTFDSFPKAVQARLPRPHEPDAVWLVWRLPAGAGATLWAAGSGCTASRCGKTWLFLQEGGAFRPLGSRAGTLVRTSAGEDGPPVLSLRQPARRGVIDLSWRDGAYRALPRTASAVDPVSGIRVPRATLDREAREDFVAGRDLSAAGRWGTLCELGCTAAQEAEEGRAALRARLVPQAIQALRAALARDPALATSRLDLGDALAAEGKLGEARAQYGQAAGAHDADVAKAARERLAALPRR